VNIRPAHSADIPGMMALDRASATAGHWSQAQYHSLFFADSRHVTLVAETDGQMDGFLVAQQVPPEWELENIVVGSDYRRRGIATELVKRLVQRAREANSDLIFLEVRESNLAGRQLYEKLGFRESGRRKAYYSDPPEDAILYQFSLK
jgi:[ribosomal protein S18]-alanine N-acetyltransferase